MISFSGLALLAISVVLPFFSTKVRSSREVVRSVAIVLAANQVITLLQITAGPLPTVDADPMAFNAYASRTGAEHLGGNSYVNFLRNIYDVLGGSHLLGCEINQIGFSIALIFFLEIVFLLGFGSYAPKLVLIWGLLPSVLLNSSVVLREGLQMAGFMVLAWALLDIRRSGINKGSLLLFPASFALIELQNGFAPYLVLVLPIALLWATGSRPWLVICALSGGVFVVVFFGGRIVERLERSSAVIRQVAQGEGLEYIGGYQHRVNQGRSDFATKLDVSSPGRLLKTGPVVAFQYFFAPMPWQVRGVLDLYGLFESLVRVSLFGYALIELRKSSGPRRQELLFLFALFLSMELVWAAGTSNWGTAFRHRVVAWGLLVCIGGPRLLAKLGLVSAPSEESGTPGLLMMKSPSIRARRRAIAKRRLQRGNAGFSSELTDT